jgi:iron complex outermembrane recepter protein
LITDTLEARLDLSSASRFPNTDELYLDGAAPTAPVYAIGDPRLGVETTWGASPTLGLRLPWIDIETSTYANFIDDYIYYAPALGPDGAPVFDVTIQGAYPRYGYRAIDAWFYGADGGLTFGPEAVVQVIGQASIVRAREADGGFLVMIPSDRASLTVRLAPRGVGPLRETFAEIGGTTVFRQTRVDPEADFAPPPAGYTLLSAALGAELPVGRDTLTLGLEGENLANARYREYTSLLRYYADEPGREIRARIGFTF